MPKFNWKNNSPKVLYFEDLKVGDTFKINTPNSQGAVYMKVESKEKYNSLREYFQVELKTGKLFDCTTSPVELVDVEINIDADKPSIAGY